MAKVKDGYKQTDIGVIPDNWEVLTLDSFSEIYGRIGFRGYTVNDIVEKEDGAIAISPSNIKHNKISFENSTYISWFKYEESPEIKIYNGDILLVKTGSTFGKTALVKGLQEKATINPQLVVLKNIKISNILLSYIMSDNVIQRQIASTIVGGAIPTLSQKQVQSFKLALPPTKKEQETIASALSDMDSLVDELTKLIEKKRDIKEGAMQQLLLHKEGWEEVTLESLTKTFTKQTGFDYTSNIKPYLLNGKSKGSIPFIQNKDFNNKWINFNTDYFIPLNIAIEFPRILLDEKCLLISISGSIGKVGLFSNKKTAFIGGAVAVLKFREPKLLDWVMYYLISEDGQNKLLGNVKAGSHQNLILDDIRKIKIPLPSCNEQFAITSVLSDIDNEIEALEQNLSKYKAIKTGMMQQLLTGQIRLI